jgi:hypothetical protein
MEKIHKTSGRQRIKDRGIEWKERYHERSEKLKKRFDKQLGPFSYIRWEGHDYTTDSDYFIIMGPSLTKEGRKRLFAGIKKLPGDPKAKIYAPAGEYFTSSTAALSHASDKWAIPFPKGAPNYTEAQLAAIEIPRHVKGSSRELIKEAIAPVAPQVEPQATPQVAPQAGVDMGYVRSFATELRGLANNFAGNVNNYQTAEQALMDLEAIQTTVQKLIASVQQGSRRNVITNTQAVQQAKTPLVDPRQQG